MCSHVSLLAGLASNSQNQLRVTAVAISRCLEILAGSEVKATISQLSDIFHAAVSSIESSVGRLGGKSAFAG